MKTIAISIEESTLATLRRLAEGPAGEDGANPRRRRSISELVREALRDYLARRGRQSREEADRVALARHRKLLGRQSAALVRGQAKP